MANKLINIGDVHQDDMFYRYKMPVVEAVVEGRGNGVKTKLANIDTIAKALDRPVAMLMRYLSASLGTAANGNILRGKHTVSALQGVLSSFIDEYVLCGICTNPETTLRVRSSLQCIRVTCKACGEKYNKNNNAPHNDIIMKCLDKQK